MAACGVQVQATLDIGALPILQGAGESVRAGILSSLHPQNVQAAREVANAADAAAHPLWPLLFDPQTGAQLWANHVEHWLGTLEKSWH